MQKVISWNWKFSSAVWLSAVEVGSTGLGFVWADQNLPNSVWDERQSNRTPFIGFAAQHCGTFKYRVWSWPFNSGIPLPHCTLPQAQIPTARVWPSVHQDKGLEGSNPAELLLLHICCQCHFTTETLISREEHPIPKPNTGLQIFQECFAH